MFRRALVFLLCLLLCALPAFAGDPPPVSEEAPAPPAFDPEQQALAEGWLALSPALGEQPVYLTEPSVSAPYAMGSLNPVYLDTGLAYVNYIRHLAGIGPVELSEHLCVQAQYGAVVLAAGDTLTHTPEKPADMEPSFFRMGANACAAGNLSMRYLYPHDSLLQNALQGQMDESSALNRLTLGHRRWLLDPALGKIGFGLATSVSGKQYIVAPVSDTSGTGPVPEAVCWPSAGQFPNSLFAPGTPWSVSLNPALYAVPAESDLQVTFTRLRDGAVFVPGLLDSRDTLDEEGTYLLVSNQPYGTGPCISFSIGKSDLGEPVWLGDYRVEIIGLQKPDGSPADLTYTVRFFDPTALSAPSAWAFPEYSDAMALGLVPESLTDLYQQPISRLEFCRLAMQVLRSASGLDNEQLVEHYRLPGPPVTFADCDHADVLAAAAIGAVRGMGDGTFCPGNSITRQDAAVLLLQSANALGLTFASAEGLLYGDQSDIAPYARPAVAWASNIRDGVNFNPVMAGVGGGLFAPQGHYTREQAILTLLRLYRSEPVQALWGAVPPSERIP